MKLLHHFCIDIYFRKYSLAQDKDILEFVMRHGAYDMVKGNSLWKMMEDRKVRQSKINVTSEICRNVYTNIIMCHCTYGYNNISVLCSFAVMSV
jgi:hypothetical protein